MNHFLQVSGLLRSCPSCHKPFAAQEVTRVMVASDDTNLPTDPPTTLIGFDKYEFPEDYRSAHVHVYKVTYKCRFCKHEWKDLAQWRS